MEKEETTSTDSLLSNNSWLDDLDEDQTFRLNRSLEQADKGEFISNEDMKAKYAA
jgi:hypothetical protein